MIPDRRCAGIDDRRKTCEPDSTSIREPALAAQQVKSKIDQTIPQQSASTELSLPGALLPDAIVQAREAEVLRRENLVTSREHALRNAQDFSVMQRDLNQQLVLANEKLVIASLQSHELAEDLERSRAEMAHLANHDFLTDLPNRMQLYDRIGQAIMFAARHQTKLAVLFLDLDKFKMVNDTLGHAIGDQLLRSVAERLKSAIRRSDTVSRHGGDEFVLLLSEVNKEENLRPKIEKIQQLISMPYRIAGSDLNIGVAIGVSIFPEHGEDTETLVRCADLAMYHAKQQGPNQYRLFNPEMRGGEADKDDMESWQHSGQTIDPRQFVLF